MKGIQQKLMEIEEYTYPTELNFEGLCEWIEELDREKKKREREKEEKFLKRLSVIEKRMVEYGEEVPMEVIVLIHLDQPVGSEVYRKYEKWLR